jgi:hypothetical protein
MAANGAGPTALPTCRLMLSRPTAPSGPPAHRHRSGRVSQTGWPRRSHRFSTISCKTSCRSYRTCLPCRSRADQPSGTPPDRPVRTRQDSASPAHARLLRPARVPAHEHGHGDLARPARGIVSGLLSADGEATACGRRRRTDPHPWRCRHRYPRHWDATGGSTLRRAPVPPGHRRTERSARGCEG